MPKTRKSTKRQSAAPQVPVRRTIAGEDEFRVWLRAYCEALTFTAVAKEHKLSLSQLSNLVAGRASIGRRMAQRFGYQRIDTVTFVPLDDKERP